MPIAYILTNMYINIDNYIGQLDRDLNVKLPIIPVDFYLAVAIFVVLFIAPIEKEKEFERYRFSEYIFDWIYDHSVLVGFKASNR